LARFVFLQLHPRANARGFWFVCALHKAQKGVTCLFPELFCHSIDGLSGSQRRRAALKKFVLGMF
jgi:hypothetical protein